MEMLFHAFLRRISAKRNVFSLDSNSACRLSDGYILVIDVGKMVSEPFLCIIMSLVSLILTEFHTMIILCLTKIY